MWFRSWPLRFAIGMTACMLLLNLDECDSKDPIPSTSTITDTAYVRPTTIITPDEPEDLEPLDIEPLELVPMPQPVPYTDIAQSIEWGLSTNPPVYKTYEDLTYDQSTTTSIVYSGKRP